MVKWAVAGSTALPTNFSAVWPTWVLVSSVIVTVHSPGAVAPTGTKRACQTCLVPRES
jgi:hypothetical protein